MALATSGAGSPSPTINDIPEANRMSRKRNHIVIVGGNFAGLAAAVKLPSSCAVTVVDPTKYFEWIPNIHEILSGVKTPQGLRLDRDEIAERAGHVFLQDRVAVLQPRQRKLVTAGGRELGFDACIVAVSSLPNTHHTPGVAEHALQFRTIADSLAIAQRLADLTKLSACRNTPG